MPRGGNQLQQERQNQRQEQHQNVQEQLQNPVQQMAPQNFGFEEERLSEEDQEIMRKIGLAAHYLNHNDALPKMKAFNDYMKKRSNQDWVQKSDEFAKLSADLYRKYENAFLKKGTMSNWEELEKEAQKALREVQQKDETSRQIRQNANMTDMERTIDELLGDRKESSDSPAYTSVWEAAEAYKKLIKEDPEDREKDDIYAWKEQVNALKNLSSALQNYASLRYKKHYGTFKGRRRMDRVTKLIALTGSILEVEPAVTAIRESAEERNAIDLDLQINFADDIQELNRENDNQMTNHWADILLPYERNGTEEVTEETRANYEDNWETIRAFKTQDDALRLTMVAKLYKRLNKLELSEKSYEKDNIVDFYKNARASKGLVSLYTIISSVIEMEENRYKNRNMELPRELAYMKSVMASEKYSSIRNATKNYLESYGFKEEGGLVDTTIHAEKTAECQSTALAAMNLAKTKQDPVIDEEMERQLQDRVLQLHQQPGYQETLRQELQNRDAAGQPDINSQAYADDTARHMRKKYIAETATQKDMARYHSEYFESSKLAQAGRKPLLNVDTHRLRDLMLVYKRGEDGEITQETRQNYDTNMKLLELFFSEDATDRIAGIAYIFLKLKKTRYTQEADLTPGNMVKKYRGTQLCYPLQTAAYNTILDAISAEKKRTKDNECLKYMDEQTDSENMRYMRQLAEFTFCSKGYDIEAQPLIKKSKEGKMNFYQGQVAGFKEMVLEGFQEERNKNNGQVVLPVEEKEEQLRQLCRSKGLM